MKILGIIAVIQFLTCAASASAWAVPITPITNPIIVGAPTIAVTFANAPPGFIVFNEYLIKPNAVITATAGGAGEVDIFAPEGIAQPVPGSNLSAFGGIQASFILGLDGLGTVELTVSGKVRTTVTTTALPDEAPFPESFIDIGPNTELIGLVPASTRFTLSWDLAVALTQDGREPQSFRTVRRVECPNRSGIICEQAHDISVLDNSFLPRPGVPSIMETTMNYSVSLENGPVAIPEPASWPLMAAASLVIGFMLSWPSSTKIMHLSRWRQVSSRSGKILSTYPTH